MAEQKPEILQHIPNLSVRHSKGFRIDLSEYFSPQDGSLWFHFVDTPPSWLNLNGKTGQIYGKAPKVSNTREYRIKLQASNKAGHIVQIFLIRVLAEDFLDQSPETLTNILSLKRRRYGYAHIHPYTPEILQYVYEYFMHPELRKQFEKSFRAFAQEHKIQLPKKIDYRAFKNALTAVNAEAVQQVEKYAQNRSQKQYEAMKEAISNEELHRLFRQGSQPQGTIVFPVWNEIGAPSLANRTTWSAIDNILDSTSTRLGKRLQINAEKAVIIEAGNRKEAEKSKPSPQFRPKKL